MKNDEFDRSAARDGARVETSSHIERSACWQGGSIWMAAAASIDARCRADVGKRRRRLGVDGWAAWRGGRRGRCGWRRGGRVGSGGSRCGLSQPQLERSALPAALRGRSGGQQRDREAQKQRQADRTNARNGLGAWRWHDLRDPLARVAFACHPARQQEDFYAQTLDEGDRFHNDWFLRKERWRLSQGRFSQMA